MVYQVCFYPILEGSTPPLHDRLKRKSATKNTSGFNTNHLCPPLRTGGRRELFPVPYRSPIPEGIRESEVVYVIKLNIIYDYNN
jgi:hypothetical protein